MANALLAWNNAVDGGLYVYADGWWTYDATINNLGTVSLSQRWVTPGLVADDTRCTLGFAGDPAVAVIALCSHNLTLAATVRIRASNVSNFASTVYDSGTVDAFATGVTEASREGLRWNFVYKLGAATAATYWRIEISDAANPDGYVSVGRLFAGLGVWIPSINMLAGAGIGFESNAEVMKALNGSEWFTSVEPHRVLRFGLQLPETEMLTNAFDLQRVAAGSRREVVAQWDASDGVHAVRRSLFGRLRTLSAIEAPYYATSKTAFEIKELL